MDEKDHLGEKFRLKERAEEDRYFAERDRELVAKLKQAKEAEQEKTIRELAQARCPQCGERLRQRSLHGVMIEECVTCQGIWLNQAKLTEVSRHKGEEWVSGFLEGLAHLLEHPKG